ncbi:MAG: UDP-N-acetylglucosamine 1-carboxyvinyltransferase [Candidatus Krumholzibacteriota bacterium]|nr:UDP-N-acetylglucosamine 1-carboxyvinyltransferase [Candidatus Krumholzibacteriota bacterium]
MDSFAIKGPCRLEGSVRISGAKNAMLPLMAATIYTGGKCRLENVPDLRDTRTMIELLKVLGIPAVLKEGVLDVDASSPSGFEAPYDLVRTMRASIYALGPLVARFGKARVSLPGGCAWGPRPINLHLQGLQSLGANITINHGYIEATAERLRGAEIFLTIPSVGATVNLMLAAALAEGKTIIENAAREPEIATLAKALNGAGAMIEGEGTSRIVIEGVSRVEPFTHRVIPDRIEAGTYAAAAVLTGGKVEINDCDPDHMHAVIDKLRSCGAKIDVSDRTIVVDGPDRIKPVDIETGFYPSFPTDMQAQMMAVMAVAEGASTFVEHVYTDRFTHVPELKRLGAKISLDGSVAVVNGVEKLEGAPVMATDIRASSALILAALVAEGDTKILRIYHIDRGYERVEEKFRNLGAEIVRVSG